MAYLEKSALEALGFKRIGKNVKISDKASIYNPELIEIGDNSRVDDFSVLSGNIYIGSFCHITSMCLIAGGVPGVTLCDFTTLAYGVKIFSQSDDYSGQTMTNSTIPKKFKTEIFQPVIVGKHVIIGAGSIVMPGVLIAEGCSIGAMSLLIKSTLPWGVYVGTPGRRLRDRNKNILKMEEVFLKEYNLNCK